MSDTTQSQTSEAVAPQVDSHFSKCEQIPFRCRVRCRITGFSGTVTGHGRWIDEPDTVLVVNEKGESRWVKAIHAIPLDTCAAA